MSSGSPGRAADRLSGSPSSLHIQGRVSLNQQSAGSGRGFVPDPSKNQVTPCNPPSRLVYKISAPWSPSLLPNKKISWIEKGVVRNLAYDRFWAEKAGNNPTPSPEELVLEGQDNSLADLIASVERGLLVTRLWYIRVVQPKTWQLTGLTRDGVFLVEKGKVTDAVNNFRWHESPAEVLQRTTKFTQPIRSNNDETGSNIPPPLSPRVLTALAFPMPCERYHEVESNFVIQSSTKAEI